MDALSLADAGSDELLALGRFLTALGDPTRQRILLLLSRQRMNVGALAERFRLSRPAISHQLKVLVHAGLLVQEREGRERVYRVDAARCRAFADRLKAFVTTCCSGKACC
jgi:DNA-binding transcriptional ArsR family regulator